MEVSWSLWKLALLFSSLFHLSRCNGNIVKFIPEEQAKNVYILNTHHELKKALPPPNERDFRIITGGEYVNITKDGDLRTKSKMDREVICPTNPEFCEIDVEVLLITQAIPFMIKVKLILTDVNDNSPQFENPRIEKEISELTAVGSVIRLDSAVDADYGQNSIVGYSIESVEQPGATKRSKPYFKLEIIKNADNTLIPQLILQRKFDREEMAVHELKLIARDGGKPSRKGIAMVRINVTDSNDNQPSFEQEKYIFSVPEDTKPNTVVAKVTATDLDNGINGKIKYTFPSVVSSSDRKLFALNQDTGEITLKDFLDYENKQMHHLTIQAEDLGPNPTSDYTTVSIKVLDVNDNKPEIKVKFFSSDNVEEEEGSISAIVPENAVIGKYLAFVTITDADKGVNGTVSCKMVSEFFSLDKVEGVDDDRYLLKTTKILDRETKATHTLTIEAKDFGIVPLTNQMTVVIKAGDVNDNAPTFDHKQFIAGVRELTKNNTVFQILKAQDRDEGENARITYRFEKSTDFIENNDRKIMLTDLFAIDKDTGEVRLIKEGVLDAETNEHPGQITVVASDSGSPSLNTTTILKISVIDDNDNIPQFVDKSDEFVFRMPEHSPYGSFIAGVPATDKDVTKSSNALITYSLKQSRRGGKLIRDPWYHFFKVSKEGELHFYGNSTKLDRESVHVSPITFIVEAKDSGTPTLSTQKLLKIYLTDINDNAPIVTSPNVTADVAFVQIPTSSSDMYYEEATGFSDTYMASDYRQYIRGRFASVVVIPQAVSSENEFYPTLTRIIATDPDEGENSHISFAIADGNNNNYFMIDHKSGNISFAKDVAFDEMKQGCHVLEIRVRDLGLEMQQTTTWVSIYVTEEKEENSNATKAMLECKKNPYFPRDYGKEKVKAGGFGKYTTIIIAGLAVGVFIIIIAIIIALCVRCNCCGVGSEKKYPIGGGGIYSANKRKRAKQNLYESNPRKIDDSGRTHPNGTVDSRSSFYSEWQQQQEKLDHVGNLPQQSNRNSVTSHHSGKDSGTGDSMPSDAYHGIHHQQHQRQPEYQENMYPQYNEYPPNQYPPPPHPEDYQQHPDHTNLIVNLPPEGVFTGKCTDDCKMYGHSDACWMPDSLQRPVSRVTTFRGQEYETGSMKRVRQDPNDMRYNPQPYYYDPVNKFDNEYPPYSTGTGGRGAGGMSSFQPSPQEPKRMSQSQGPPGSFSPSSHPSFRSNQGGPRMIPNQLDEANSNLSSTSSNNPNHYNHPRNQQQYYPHFQGYHEPPVSAGYNQPQYYDPNGYNPHGQGFQPPYQLEPSEGEPLNFEEDYSASNLLSPQDADARYFLPSDNPLPGPHSNYQTEYNLPYHEHETTDESKNLVNSDHGKDSQTSDEEKLKPIREDIDAEEVVNEINTLLLDDSPNKSLDRRYYGNEV